MKIEINPLFGKLRGRVGDLVFKQVNGKNYVAARPHPRSKSSYSDIEKARQKRFAMNCKLSTAINKIDVLRPLWHKAADGKMSSHNAISKANYPLIGHNEFLIAPKLTPNSIGFDISSVRFNYNDGRMSVIFLPDTFGLVKDYNVDNNVMLAGVIYVRNPFEEHLSAYRFMSIKSDAVKVINGEVIAITHDIGDVAKQVIESYSDGELFYCLITLDKDCSVVNTVSTFNETLFGLNE